MGSPHHFLIVTFSIPSHVNPSLHLARRLLSLDPSAIVTLSTSSSAGAPLLPWLADGSGLAFAPLPDGYETSRVRPDATSDSDKNSKDSNKEFATLVLDLAKSRGRHVTCVVYTLLLTWAADVAKELNIPSVQYWIQPATVFGAYYHYFHGYEALISTHADEPRFPVDLPGLPPMEIRDLPSFLLERAEGQGPYHMILELFKNNFKNLDVNRAGSRPKILVNTFEELEPKALVAIDGVELIPVGPILPSESGSQSGPFKPEDKAYMEWLDSKPMKSVVYVSFGSISVLQKQQIEEISKGLKESGRPYLWVVRRDSRHEGVELEVNDGDGMVVEWCSQVKVLEHPSVGCFVTHCGWNSTVESMVSGVPTVGVPQWTDQMTNVMLMEKVWEMGVRVEVDEDGVLEGGELRRCLDLVMGDAERGRKIRKNAEMWKEKALEATADGGSSDRNLRAFVQGVKKNDPQNCC